MARPDRPKREKYESPDKEAQAGTQHRTGEKKAAQKEHEKRKQREAKKSS